MLNKKDNNSILIRVGKVSTEKEGGIAYMSIKRCVALVLALFLLFTDASRAFAYDDVSGNETVPFELEETAGTDIDAEPVVTVEEDANFEAESFSSGEVGPKTVVNVEPIEGYEDYVRTTYYAHLERPDLDNMYFEVEYSDGSTATYYHYDDEVDKYGIYTKNNDVYEEYFDNLVPGTYYYRYIVCGYDVYIQFTVISCEDYVREMVLDSSIELSANGYYDYDMDCRIGEMPYIFKADLEADVTYMLSDGMVTDGKYVSVYSYDGTYYSWEADEWIYGEDFYFKPDSAGTYYIVVDDVDEACSLRLEEAPEIESVSFNPDASQTTVFAGINSSEDGYEDNFIFDVKFVDGTIEQVSWCSNLGMALGIAFRADYDEENTDTSEVGSYSYNMSCDGYMETTIGTVTVVDPKVDAIELELGQQYSWAGWDTYKLNVKNGNTYMFSSTWEGNQTICILFDDGISEYDERNDYELRSGSWYEYKAYEDGTIYIVKERSDYSGYFMVEGQLAIKKINMTGPSEYTAIFDSIQDWHIIIAQSDYELVFSDGSKITCEGYDETWNKYSRSFGYAIFKEIEGGLADWSNASSYPAGQYYIIYQREFDAEYDEELEKYIRLYDSSKELGRMSVKVNSVGDLDELVADGTKYPYSPTYYYDNSIGETIFIGSFYRAIDLVAGNTYKFDSTKFINFYLYDETGKIDSKYGYTYYYNCEKTGTYYFKLDSSADGYLSISVTKAVTDIKITKYPDQAVYYEGYFSNSYSSTYDDLYGIELEITYSDGEKITAVYSYDETNPNALDNLGVKAYLVNSDKGTSYELGIFNKPAPGNYYLKIQIPGFEACDYVPITIKSASEFESLEVDGESVTAITSRFFEYISDDGAYCYRGQPNFYKLTLEADTTYTITATEQIEMRVFPEGNNENENTLIYIDGNTTAVFKAEKAGTYIAQVFCEDTSELSLSKGGKTIKNIKVVSCPTKTTITQGFDWFDLEGLSVKATFDDDTSQTIKYSEDENSDWKKILQFNWSYVDPADGIGSSYDENGNYKIGSHVIYLNFANFDDIKIPTVFKVVAPKFNATLNIGGSYSFKANEKLVDNSVIQQSPIYLKVLLEGGKAYNFSFADKGIEWYHRSIEIYNSSYSYLHYYSRDFVFTPGKTGWYYLKLYSTKADTISVQQTVCIVDASLSEDCLSEITGYTDLGLGKFNGSAIKIELVFEDGTSVICKFCDETWSKYGIDSYITDASKERTWDYSQPGQYYYAITVPSYEEIFYIPITLVDKNELEEIILGKSYEVPQNITSTYNEEDDTYTSAGKAKVYRVELEAGKKYEIIPTSKEQLTTIYYFDSWYSSISDTGRDPFFIPESCTAFVFVEAINEDTSFVMKETHDVKDVEVSGPIPNCYYGEEDPVLKDISFTVTYDDESTEVIDATGDGAADFCKGITHYSIYKSDKKTPAKRDKNDCYPIGTYYFKVILFKNWTEGEEVWVKFDIVKSTKSYDVIFNANDGTEVSRTQTFKANTPAKLTKNTFKRDGYEFVGWSMEAKEPLPTDATEEDILEAIDFENQAEILNLVTDGSDVPLYAVWKESLYTITYVLAGGEMVDEGKFVASYCGSDDMTIELPIAEDIKGADGFEFKGWFTDTAYKNAITEIATTSRKSYVLYAKWSPAKYSVKFDPNGATGTMKDMDIYYGIDTTLTAKGFKLANNAFLGWSFEPVDTTGLSYEESLAKVDYNDKATMDISKCFDKVNDTEKTLTLYAVWKSEFTVAYNANGGTIDTEDSQYIESYTFGKKYKLVTPKREGYTFKGWYLDEEFTTKLASITDKTVGDLKLYAMWTPIMYTIKFDANGGTGKTAQMALDYDEAGNLTANGFAKKGYVFAGWTDDSKMAKVVNKCADEAALESAKAAYPDAEIYEDCEEVVNLLNTNKKSVKLYAMWVETTYTITFDSNDGTSCDAIVYKYNSKGATDVAGTKISLPTPEKEDYDFVDWYTDETLKTKADLKKLSGDVTLYAKWNALYTIHFDGNGGTAKKEMADLTKVKLTDSKALTANTYSYSYAEGKSYVFMGWSTTKYPAGATVDYSTLYANKAKVTNPDGIVKNADGKFVLTLYAVWAKDFSITYEPNGGVLPECAESYEYGTGISTLVTPLRVGYSFGGWYMDEKYKKAAKSISKTQSGDVKLYAKWSGLKYTVTFDTNAPKDEKVSGKTGNASLVYGTDKALTKNGYKVKGYTFLGWSRQPQNVLPGNATEEQIAEAVEFTNAEKISGIGIYYVQKHTLYAVWQKDIYIITFDLNGLTCDEEIIPMTYDVHDTIEISDLPIPSRLGYTFGGWYTDKACKKKAGNIKEGTTGDKTFYAKMTPNK